MLKHTKQQVRTYLACQVYHYDIIQKLGNIFTIVCVPLMIRDMHSFIRACSYIRTHTINTLTYKVSYRLRRYAVFTGLAFQAIPPSTVTDQVFYILLWWSCHKLEADHATPNQLIRLAGNSLYQLIWHPTPITTRTSMHFWNGPHVLHELLQPVCT